MSEEKEKTESGLRIAQVLAAALAAVTAALLGSTLGVAGTVVGAGVASIVTTVGGEVYLRSLQRTKDAALRARALATSGIRRRALPELPAEIPLEDQPTVRLPKPSRLRKLRWPLLIGTSVVAFAVAILTIVGFESATGTQIGGGTGKSIGKIFGGDRPADPAPSSTPKETPTPPATTETTTTAPPTTTTTESPTPSTTTSPPSTSAPPTTTPPPSSVAPTTTPTP